MWIVDDEGDLFNTDHYRAIDFGENEIQLWFTNEDGELRDVYKLSPDLNKGERLTRYYDLVEILTGLRIDV